MSRGLFYFVHLVVVFTVIGLILLFEHIFAFLFGTPPSLISTTAESATIVGLGLILLLGVKSFRVIAARHTRSEHDRYLRAAYSQLHCRDARFVEITDEALLYGCACSTTAVPWPQFVVLTESVKYFILLTAAAVLAIPKTAFGSEADRTEFRAALSRQLSRDKLLTDRAIECACNRHDWLNGLWLQLKAGDWIPVTRCVRVGRRLPSNGSPSSGTFRFQISI